MNIQSFVQKYRQYLLAVVVLVILGGLYAFQYVKNQSRLESFDISPTITKKRVQPSQESSQPSREATISVYVCGAVNKPGVYELTDGARVGEALALSGGMNRQASIQAINLAARVKDGQQIYFPTKSEWEKGESLNLQGQSAASQEHATSASSGSEMSSQKVNINIATESELETLSGVGPSTAQKIIEYRTKNGNFSSLDDLKNITGIGDKRVEAIREEAVAQ